MLCNITQLAFKLFYFLSSQIAKWTKIPRNKKCWLRCVFHIPLPPLLFIPKLLKWPLNSHQAEGFRSLSNYLSAAPRFCTLQTFRTSLVEDKCSSADLIVMHRIASNVMCVLFRCKASLLVGMFVCLLKLQKYYSFLNIDSANWYKNIIIY